MVIVDTSSVPPIRKGKRKLNRAGDLIMQMFEQIQPRERANLSRRVEGISNHEPFHVIGHLPRKGIGVSDHDKPLGRDAALAGVDTTGVHRSLCNRGQIGVCHDDKRIRAPQFQNTFFQDGGRCGGYRPAGAFAPGKRHGGDERVTNEFLGLGIVNSDIVRTNASISLKV